MLVANNDAPISGQARLRSARKKRLLLEAESLRIARYRPTKRVVPKTRPHVNQSIQPREKAIVQFSKQVRVRECQIRRLGRSQQRAARAGHAYCAVTPPSMIQLLPVIDLA